jgi:hypothetical protein
MRARTSTRLTLFAACALIVAMPLMAQQSQGENESAGNSSRSEIDQLKSILADQQRQIDELKRLIGQQAQASSTSSTAAPVRFITAANNSMTPAPYATPAINAAPSVNASQAAGAGKNPCEATPDGPTPAFIRVGSTCLIPIGFIDLTSVWRDKDAGSSLGSNFGGIPYNNTPAGKNSEFRFTPQNSRIGFRFDGDWKGTHFIGYNEFDFLGTSGSNGITVTNGGFVPRLRLFWLDVRKDKWEFLAGQSWSMMTPNRSGISALPANVFFSQTIDVNYMAGLTWTRQPGVRVLYHPSNKVTFGFSAENPDQYIGGSAGGSGIQLPAALASLSGSQLDAANIVLSAPTLHPDFILKIAFDPSSRLHMEVAGIERTFKIWNPNTAPALGAGQYSTKAGGGVQFGINGEIVKGLHLISTNYWSDGGGRYLFGQAPDVIVRADGSLSPIHSGGTVDGFEATVKNWLLYGYYGGIYIQRNTAFDANGTTRIGYGYTGSPNSMNRSVQEVTFGFNRTLWKDARYGAINAMGQYEWLNRDPWFVAIGNPKSTHDNTIFFNLRYTLPGSMPNF